MDASVTRSFSEPNIGLHCECGWSGTDDDITDWSVEVEQDRVVRQCPNCEQTVPQWGVLEPIRGACKIARGPLKRALVEAGYEFDGD